MKNRTVIGIVCIVLCLCGLGSLVALVMGWVNADTYNIRKILPIYPAAFVGAFFFGVFAGVNAPENVIVIQQPRQP